MSDVQRALDMFAALGLTGDDLFVIIIPGAPPSKSRARFTKHGHAYATSKDKEAEKKTALYLRSKVKEPFPGNVGLACIFYRPNRQRIDTDNMLKHVCDAANGILWADDSQCTAIVGITEMDAGNPRTVIAVGEHVSTLKRGVNNSVPCRVCDKPINLSSRARGPGGVKTCSTNCANIHRGYQSLADPVPCGYCQQPFKRRTKTQRFCSSTCRGGNLSNQKRAVGRPFSKCVDCGKELTHKRGGRCRDCWKSSRKKE